MIAIENYYKDIKTKILIFDTDEIVLYPSEAFTDILELKLEDYRENLFVGDTIKIKGKGKIIFNTFISNCRFIKVEINGEIDCGFVGRDCTGEFIINGEKFILYNCKIMTESEKEIAEIIE